MAVSFVELATSPEVPMSGISSSICSFDASSSRLLLSAMLTGVSLVSMILVEDMELLRNLLVMSLRTLLLFLEVSESLSPSKSDGIGVTVVTGKSRGDKVIGTRLPVEGGTEDIPDDVTVESPAVLTAVVSHGGGGSCVLTVLVLVKVVTESRKVV